jgi:hypothetical protein
MEKNIYIIAGKKKGSRIQNHIFTLIVADVFEGAARGQKHYALV